MMNNDRTPKSPQQSEVCKACGQNLTLVRPGSYQCDNEGCSTNEQSEERECVCWGKLITKSDPDVCLTCGGKISLTDGMRYTISKLNTEGEKKTEERIRELADAAFEEYRGGNIGYWTSGNDDPEAVLWKQVWIMGYKSAAQFQGTKEK